MSKGLGKGLNALFLNTDADVRDDDIVKEVEVLELRANPYQPRKHFDEDGSLNELAESVKQHGIIQPLIVRKSIRGYEIVAGERRFRAAKQVGLEKVPVVVRDYTDNEMMEIALVENLQREDLNPIEVAMAYQKLLQHLHLTQEQLSERVGVSRSHVTNFIRLLQLPAEIQENVSRGTLSMGHARALLGVKDSDLQKRLAKKVIEEETNVRQLEEWIQRLNQKGNPKSEKSKQEQELSPEMRHFEGLLQEIFSTSVKIRPGRRKGKIEIEYYSERELERIVELLQQDRIL
ncbi:ParB/RepB/Spo0J family partition protein [Thermoactinomyces sp. DSM 45892]|uniref:ParB/RepB/Spo0J family partition protein n=1 Tax=Thermoactinomyces sp. DSM 45892 TaxID=1882753 RepID=UPI00089D2862|nr:ParB/RepB/Spo0J family partition protein [Thermoactinomyces sp. DSM 45892]SDY36814.1 chromosome segregation DNA-binding protein [Thermoactinomyces sp. DSM 45892]